MKQVIATETSKSAPPAAITGLAVVDAITLNEWVAIATIVYVGLQAAYLIYKWVKEYRSSK
jgi:hypothetical protein